MRRQKCVEIKKSPAANVHFAQPEISLLFLMVICVQIMVDKL